MELFTFNINILNILLNVFFKIVKSIEKISNISIIVIEGGEIYVRVNR